MFWKEKTSEGDLQGPDKVSQQGGLLSEDMWTQCGWEVPGLDQNHWKGVAWKIVGDASQAEYMSPATRMKTKSLIQGFLYIYCTEMVLPQFSSVQLLSRVRRFATPWIAAPQASLSITSVVGPNYPDWSLFWPQLTKDLKQSSKASTVLKYLLCTRTEANVKLAKGT